MNTPRIGMRVVSCSVGVESVGRGECWWVKGGLVMSGAGVDELETYLLVNVLRR